MVLESLRRICYFPKIFIELQHSLISCSVPGHKTMIIEYAAKSKASKFTSSGAQNIKDVKVVYKLRIIWHFLHTDYKRLANAKRPCDCSVLCLCPKSALCCSLHCILDITSFGSASNNGVGQFKPIFQVEGKSFHPIFFDHFIADWLLYNYADGSFHTTKLCSRLYSIEIKFYSERLKNWCLSHPLGDLGVMYALH